MKASWCDSQSSDWHQKWPIVSLSQITEGLTAPKSPGNCLATTRQGQPQEHRHGGGRKSENFFVSSFAQPKTVPTAAKETSSRNPSRVNPRGLFLFFFLCPPSPSNANIDAIKPMMANKTHQNKGHQLLSRKHRCNKANDGQQKTHQNKGHQEPITLHDLVQSLLQLEV